VPRALASSLKAEAQRRRLSVSELIRNVLEDSLDLVDGVVADVDQIVSDSLSLARNVGRSARRIASPSRGEEPEPAPQPGLSHIYAWNEVVLNQAVQCSRCGQPLRRGEHGFAGLSDELAAERAWLCAECVSKL